MEATEEDGVVVGLAVVCVASDGAGAGAGAGAGDADAGAGAGAGAGADAGADSDNGTGTGTVGVRGLDFFISGTSTFEVNDSTGVAVVVLDLDGILECECAGEFVDVCRRAPHTSCSFIVMDIDLDCGKPDGRPSILMLVSLVPLNPEKPRVLEPEASTVSWSGGGGVHIIAGTGVGGVGTGVGAEPCSRARSRASWTSTCACACACAIASACTCACACCCLTL